MKELYKSGKIVSNKGKEILKNLKSKGINSNDNTCCVQNNDITKFSDYDTFLNVSKAYSKYYVENTNDDRPPQSIYETKKSYILGENIIINDNCDSNCNSSKP